MPAGLSKDIIFLFCGILRSFALESQPEKLNGVISPDGVSLLCLAIFAIVTGGYLVFRHYHHVLSGGPEDTARRKAYDNLRASLADGGNPARLYAQWLERALHLVERF